MYPRGPPEAHIDAVEPDGPAVRGVRVVRAHPLHELRVLAKRAEVVREIVADDLAGVPGPSLHEVLDATGFGQRGLDRDRGEAVLLDQVLEQPVSEGERLVGPVGELAEGHDVGRAKDRHDLPQVGDITVGLNRPQRQRVHGCPAREGFGRLLRTDGHAEDHDCGRHQRSADAVR